MLSIACFGETQLLMMVLSNSVYQQVSFIWTPIQIIKVWVSLLLLTAEAEIISLA